MINVPVLAVLHNGTYWYGIKVSYELLSVSAKGHRGDHGEGQ